MVFLLRIHSSSTQMTGKPTVMIVADVNEPMFRPSTDLGRNRQLARGSTIDCADIRGLGPVRSRANNGERYLHAGESFGQRQPGRERELNRTSNSIELFPTLLTLSKDFLPRGHHLVLLAGCIFASSLALPCELSSSIQTSSETYPLPQRLSRNGADPSFAFWSPICG
jgi:hypothetical protein